MENILSGIKLATKSARARARLEKLQATVAKLEASEVEMVQKAQARVEQLTAAEVAPTLIKTILEAEFGRARKATRAPRQNRELTAEVQAAVVAHVAANPGVGMPALWAQFPEVDRTGLAQYVRTAALTGTLRGEGTTRARKYFAA